MIVDVPTATVVTTPVLPTVAMDGSSDDQVRVGLAIAEPPASVTVAVMSAVTPRPPRTSGLGHSVIEAAGLYARY